MPQPLSTRGAWTRVSNGRTSSFLLPTDLTIHVYMCSRGYVIVLSFLRFISHDEETAAIAHCTVEPHISGPYGTECSADM